MKRGPKPRPNPIRLRPDGTAAVGLVSLRGTTAEVLVDAADLQKLAGWRCFLKGGVPYADRHDRGRHEMTPLARLLVGCAGPGERVKVRDGDALDCRRANLLVVACKPPRQPGPKLPGCVHFDRLQRKWVVSFIISGRRRHFGQYTDRAAAEARRDELRARLAGGEALTPRGRGKARGGVKHVYFDRANGRWYAQASVGGVRRFIASSKRRAEVVAAVRAFRRSERTSAA